ncbi:MAG: natural product precursor [Flammeovirgaceae bacterium]|jgi:natural product precursor
MKNFAKFAGKKMSVNEMKNVKGGTRWECQTASGGKAIISGNNDEEVAKSAEGKDIVFCEVMTN